MSRRQRLVFLAIAVVIAVLAVVLLAGGSDDEEPTASGTTAAETTPTPEASGTSEPEEASPVETATPEPKPPLFTAAKPGEVKVKQGERVEFRVRHDAADEIHVHGYDIYEDVPAGETITVSFKADLTGIWEVELHDAGRPVGSLRVEP